MRSLIGFAVIALAITATIAGISRLSPAAPGPDANVAAVRHHLDRCRLCRESGISPERLARSGRPIPCQVRYQAPATD